ncbi:MAG: hypothetical protein JST16_06730 [Bdellovibrionales bacterium]|nr:hypothetical protein [Bdellovibrionales bacterium]
MNTEVFNQKFLSWLSEWSHDLWTVCAYTSKAHESIEDDFRETLELARRKMRTRFRVQLGEKAAGLFFREWFRLQEVRSPRSSLSALEPSSQDRALLATLFKCNWTFEKAARVFGLSATATRHRALQALSFYLAVPESGLRPLGRDCFRADLYILDQLRDLSWHDPLHFFGPRDFTKHLSGCARCSALSFHLQETIKQIHAYKLPPMVDMRHVQSESSSHLSSRWFLLSWISTWPWFVRVPVQLVGAALVVFTVVTIPYLGDLFPEVTRSLPQFKRQFRESVTGVKRLVPVPSVPAPPPSPPAPQLPMAEPAVVAANTQSAPVVVPPAPPPAPVPPAPPAQAASPVAVVEANDQNPKTFFQWAAFTPDLDGDRAKILALLQKYAAEKAGDLNFGAHYLGGLYFHFNITDADYEHLVSEIEALGLQKFTRKKGRGIKDRPAGKTRVVLLLKHS